jgi:hypothetical protein
MASILDTEAEEISTYGVILGQNLGDILVVSFAHTPEALPHFLVHELLGFDNRVDAIRAPGNAKKRSSVCFQESYEQGDRR